jgi:hypothetical protein
MLQTAAHRMQHVMRVFAYTSLVVILILVKATHLARRFVVFLIVKKPPL